MRQQEAWGITTLDEVLAEASDKVRARLGLHVYGTLGQFAGAAPPRRGAQTPSQVRANFGNRKVRVPDAVVGIDAALHPVRRVSRAETIEPDARR